MTTNKELRELAEEAKSGAWYDSGNLRYYDERTGEAYELQHSEGLYLAAASPEAILALLDENETLQAEREKLRKDAVVLMAALKAIQTTATHKSIRTGIQAGTALGIIAAVCDVALAARRKQGDGR